MMLKIYRASLVCLTLLFPAALGAQVTSERLAARRRRAAKLANLFGNLLEPTVQPAKADRRCER